MVWQGLGMKLNMGPNMLLGMGAGYKAVHAGESEIGRGVWE